MKGKRKTKENMKRGFWG